MSGKDGVCVVVRGVCHCMVTECWTLIVWRSGLVDGGGQVERGGGVSHGCVVSRLIPTTLWWMK